MNAIVSTNDDGTTLEQPEPDSIYFITSLEKEIDFDEFGPKRPIATTALLAP
jgi:hypothetical protein